MKSIVGVVILLVVSASAFKQCGKRGPLSRIIHGFDANQGEFPWQISLRLKNYGHTCGGTLISQQWVLCAAHCFEGSNKPQIWQVRVGEWKQDVADGTEKDYDVDEIHVHKQFSSPMQFQHDISLIKLKKPVDFSGPYAGPACMPAASDDYRGHTECTLSGWGLIKRFPETKANQLQKVTSNIWTQKDLEGQWGKNLPPDVVGFGEPFVFSACMGDSGGPLVCPNQNGAYDVIGVVSFGPGVCIGKPGVFTEVAAFRSWITAITGAIF